MKGNVLIYLMSTPRPNGGGVSYMTYRISEGLKAYGYNVLFLCFEVLDTDTPLENVYYFPVLKDPYAEDNKTYLDVFVRKYNVKFIINQIPLNEYYADLLYSVKTSGIRIASVIHNSSLNFARHFAYSKEYGLREQGKSWVFHLLKIWPIRQAIIAAYIKKHRSHYMKMENGSDYIVAVSDRNKEDICILIGHHSPKVISISNFINTNDCLIPAKEKLVIWCGRLETHNKRVDLMIDIWARICRKYSDWKLALMGLEESIGMHDYAKLVGAENIIFTGPVKPTDYYMKASIICHTSISESFGLVLVEAMNWGCIPIAFDSFPACQDIIPNDCGYRVKAFDKDKYAKILSDLMEGETERRIRAVRSKEYSNRFNEKSSIKEWINIIEQF